MGRRKAFVIVGESVEYQTNIIPSQIDVKPCRSAPSRHELRSCDLSQDFLGLKFRAYLLFTVSNYFDFFQGGHASGFKNVKNEGSAADTRLLQVRVTGNNARIVEVNHAGDVVAFFELDQPKNVSCCFVLRRVKISKPAQRCVTQHDRQISRLFACFSQPLFLGVAGCLYFFRNTNFWLTGGSVRPITEQQWRVCASQSACVFHLGG